MKIKVLIFVLIFQIFHANSSRAAIADWSFSDNPNPRSQELSQAEVTKLEQNGSRETGYDNFCAEYLDVEFEIYNARYPAFSQFGDRGERFRVWKYHVMRDQFPTRHNCIETMPWILVLEIFGVGDLVFCGVFSRAPKTVSEHAFANAVLEMVSYAELGRLESLNFLRQLNGPSTNISLNGDVEYFIRRMLIRHEYYHRHSDTRHLERHLSSQRRRFLDVAVERQDFRSVLDTTHACNQAPLWHQQINSDKVPTKRIYYREFIRFGPPLWPSTLALDGFDPVRILVSARPGLDDPAQCEFLT